MADFGIDQQRTFILDNSQPNGATLGKFLQNNNRYICNLELFDNGEPVSLPDAAEIEVRCRQDKANSTIYVLDKDHPDYNKIQYTPGSNRIVLTKWEPLIGSAGPMLLGVSINGMSTYTVRYTVDEDKLAGRANYPPGTPVSSFADKNLDNVPQQSLLAAGKAAGFAQNDLADVDLYKLDEKFQATDSGKALSQLQQAVTPKALDLWLKQNPAFVSLQDRHPATTGLTPEQIKALFFANRFEITTSVDLTADKYGATTLYLVYQLTRNNQTINQILPELSKNQLIMVEVLRSTGVTGGKVSFTTRNGEMLNGASVPLEISTEGYNGYFIPMQNENSWDFFDHVKTQPYSMAVSDEKGNISVGVRQLIFKNSTIESDDNGIVNVVPDLSAPSPAISATPYMDGITKKEFIPNKVQSTDQTVRIASMPDGSADFSVDLPHIKEGIFATLGFEEPINTNFHDQRPYFTPRYSHMQRYVGVDVQDKGFTVQDGSMQDPLISGGSTFHMGMWFEPTQKAVATADGFLELKVIDLTTKTYVVQPDGNVAAVRIEYKAGDVLKPELLLCTVTVKGQQKIAFEIDASFQGQIITASPFTAIYIQQVDNAAGTGLAEMFFAQHIGYTIRSADRYYGYNLMNFAAALTKTKGVEQLLAGSYELMGNGMFISAGSSSTVNLAISDNKLTIMGNGTDIPVFCVGKIFTPIETKELQLKVLATTVKLQNKNNAFTYALMRWTKDGEAKLPILVDYQNEQPIFEDGWVLVDKKFIGEDPVSDEHVDTNAFTVPDGATQVAVILYPTVSQIPTTLILSDFEVDVKPAFTVPTIASAFPTPELHLRWSDYLYRSIVQPQSSELDVRYTGDLTERKLPFGNVSGGDNKLVNDRSWNTPGTTWSFEGDGEFKADGEATINYEVPAAYCGEKVAAGTTVQCEVWMARSSSDGAFVEVPGSRVDFVVSKDFPGAKHVVSPKFKIKVNKGDKLRMFFTAGVAEGVYFQSGNGQPLLKIYVDFNELEEIDQRIIDMIKAASTKA